jgi:outer membrane protein assembly factor BamB
MKEVVRLILVAGVAACGALALPARSATPVAVPSDRSGLAWTGGCALDGVRGQRWALQTEGPVRSSPAVAGELVLVGSDDGALYAADRRSGALRWRTPLQSPVTGSPVVDGDRVFVTTAGNRLWALALADGTPLWSVDGGAHERLRGAWDLFASTPLRIGHKVVFGSSDGRIRAVDRDSGKVAWTFDAGEPIRSSPSAYPGGFVVGGMGGHVFNLGNDGRLKWKADTDGVHHDFARDGYDRTAVQASAAISDGLAVIGGRDGTLYGFDLASGAQRWKLETGTSWIVATPVARDGHVVFGSSDAAFVAAVDRHGAQQWKTPVGDNVLASPLACGDQTVFATFQGRLISLDDEGRVLWRYGHGGKIVSSPAGDGESLFYGSDDGRLVAVAVVPPGAPKRAFYFDEQPGAWRWSHADLAEARERLQAAGYTPLGWDTLAAHLQAPQPGVVVFLTDNLPEAVLGDAAASPLRGFLERGGKAVWTGLPPGGVRYDAQGNPGPDPARPRQLFGLTYETGAIPTDLRATATADGARWGLRPWTVATLSVDPSAVDEVLALDSDGRATAWRKRYGDRPYAGFVQLWSQEGYPPDIDELMRVAEAGGY